MKASVSARVSDCQIAQSGVPAPHVFRELVFPRLDLMWMKIAGRMIGIVFAALYSMPLKAPLK